MASHKGSDPGRAVTGERSTTDSVPAPSDIGDNSASEVIEAPQGAGRAPLNPHDFGDGGGGGGGEAFRRGRRPKPG